MGTVRRSGRDEDDVGGGQGSLDGRDGWGEGRGGSPDGFRDQVRGRVGFFLDQTHRPMEGGTARGPTTRGQVGRRSEEEES